MFVINNIKSIVLIDLSMKYPILLFLISLQLFKLYNCQSNFFNNTHFGHSLVNETTGAHLFYHFIPCIDDDITNPKKPVILFLQGGPGCAGEYANLNELGPYKVENQSGTLNLVPREYTWSTEAHILFVDNPSDTGYSIPGNELVSDSETSAKQIYHLLEDFYTNYTSLMKVDFWVFGESYGGHYVPAVAFEILSFPSLHIAKLTGIGMQNPWTDAFSQLEYFAATPYAQGLIDPKQRDKIRSMILEGQKDIYNNDFAAASVMFDDIEDWITSSNVTNGIFMNNYRYWQNGDPVGKIFEAYALTQAYLNQADIKGKFGVPSDFNYGLCNGTIYKRWSLDSGTSYLSKLGYVLDYVKGVIYNGADDTECNTAGVLSFINRMDWTGRKQFKQARKQIWKMNGNKVAGTARVGGSLIFATVYGAGHYVPFDQLLVSVDLLQRVLAGNDDWDKPFNL